MALMGGGPAPNERFPVGSEATLLGPALMRDGEDFDSVEVMDIPNSQVILVVEHGTGPSGRRLKVRLLGEPRSVIEGWISCMNSTGEEMLSLVRLPDPVPDTVKATTPLRPEAADVLPVQSRQERHSTKPSAVVEKQRPTLLAIADKLAPVCAQVCKRPSWLSAMARKRPSKPPVQLSREPTTEAESNDAEPLLQKLRSQKSLRLRDLRRGLMPGISEASNSPENKLPATAAFPVGTELAVLETTLVRKGEDFTTEEMIDLELGQQCIVLMHGTGPTGRRLLVRCHDHNDNVVEGWISCINNYGQELVEKVGGNGYEPATNGKSEWSSKEATVARDLEPALVTVANLEVLPGSEPVRTSAVERLEKLRATGGDVLPGGCLCCIFVDLHKLKRS